MAPEQLQGKPRPASDQYALGVVVYEWVCGTRPFQGTATELYSQHRFAPPPSLREQVPTIPPAVEHVVFKALAKDPQERFASMLAFATAWKRPSRQSHLRGRSLCLPRISP
jgi:serine/threonine protein kinase